jgi:hypothetical protein
MIDEVSEARRCLALLELGPGSSFDQVRAAYRGLVRLWHPDQFEADVEHRIKAEEKLKEINAAYAWVEAHRGVLDRLEPEADESMRRPRAAPRAAPATTGPAESEGGRRRSERLRPAWVYLGVAAGVAVAAVAFLATPSRDALRLARPAQATGFRHPDVLRAAGIDGRTHYVQAPRSRVRALPGASAEVVSVLLQGERVRGFRRFAGWIEIGRTGSTDPIGWVRDEHLGPEPPKRAAPWALEE